MNLRIIVPMRPLAEAKSRLGDVLPPAPRAALARQMFCHVLRVAEAYAPTSVVSRDRAVLALASSPISDRATGLNPALEQARVALDGTAPLLALSADLPLLSVDDLRAMVSLLPTAEVIAAPDRAGTGTNALLLARPGLIPYLFGDDSFARHRTAAAERRLRFAVCERAGLATDIDRPEDLALLPPGLLSAA